MADEEQRSLTDDEIKSDYRTNPDLLRDALRHADALEQYIRDAGDRDRVEVPVESLQSMRRGVLVLAKSQTELGFLGFGDNDRGDRGPRCDYKPFIKVDIGDL